MDLHRQAFGNDGRFVSGLQSVSDLLSALAVASLAVAVGHRQQIALDDVVANRAAAHVGRIVRAGVADDRRDLPNVRHMPSHPDIRSRD